MRVMIQVLQEIAVQLTDMDYTNTEGWKLDLSTPSIAIIGSFGVFPSNFLDIPQL